MKKNIYILSIVILIFVACENKKANNQQTENTDIKTATAESYQPAKSRLEITTTVADDKTIKKKGKIKVTFVELGSVRCIPCKMMIPIMKEIEEKYGDEVKVIFYDVWTDAGRPYAEKYRVRAIPTQVFLDENGREFFRHVGFFPREELFLVLKKQGVNIK